jgi:hypothetical protein
MVKSTARVRLLSFFVLPALALAALVAPGSEGHALAQKKAGGPKPKPACGLRNLPLFTGASWTYKSGVDEMKITVESVAPGKDAEGKPATVIKVDETYKNESLKLDYTCTDKEGLRVPPESFFFTGEPGGIYGDTVTITKHEDVWLHPDVEAITDSGWQEKIKADVTRADTGGRGAKHPDAKIEVERYVVVKGVDLVVLPLGQYNATKVQFELRSRAFIGEDKTEQIIDDKNPGALWMVKDLGVVQVEDNLKTRRTWELVATTVTK